MVKLLQNKHFSIRRFILFTLLLFSIFLFIKYELLVPTPRERLENTLQNIENRELACQNKVVSQECNYISLPENKTVEGRCSKTPEPENTLYCNYRYGNNTAYDVEYENWETYTNDVRKFEVSYPSNLNAREVYTHNVVVCFDNEERPFEVCVSDDLMSFKRRNDPDVYHEFSLDVLEYTTGYEAKANIYEGNYSVYINNIIIYSKNKELLNGMLSTMQILGKNEGAGKY